MITIVRLLFITTSNLTSSITHSHQMWFILHETFLRQTENIQSITHLLRWARHYNKLPHPQMTISSVPCHVQNSHIWIDLLSASDMFIELWPLLGREDRPLISLIISKCFTSLLPMVSPPRWNQALHWIAWHTTIRPWAGRKTHDLATQSFRPHLRICETPVASQEVVAIFRRNVWGRGSHAD